MFNFNDISSKAILLANKMVFKTKQHSPEILLVCGTVSVIAGVVVACKSTFKAQEVLAEAKDHLDIIRGLESGELPKKPGTEYTEDDAGKERVATYAKLAIDIAATYAPAALLIGGGLGCFYGSHAIMRKRNAAAVAAYSAMAKAFEEYRKRVKEEYGEEAEAKIRSGMKSVDIVNLETGETDTKTEYNADADPYSFLFDEINSKYWQKDLSYNRGFLISCQQAANRKLKSKGFLCLNEVLDMVGIHGTKIGQFAGWIYDKNDPTCCVDFGLRNGKDETDIFMEGNELNVWLSFNCEDNIIDKI